MVPVSAAEKGERELVSSYFGLARCFKDAAFSLEGVEGREGRKWKGGEGTTRERDQGMGMLVVLLFLSPGRKMTARA